MSQGYPSPLFSRMTVIGMGLIGSSIARGAHAKHLAGTIVGCDQNEIALAIARKQGFIDMAAKDPLSAVTNSGLVIIATPPSSFSAIARAIAANLKPGTLVMDTGSVKQPAMHDLEAYLPTDVDFVPVHPIAGSEQSGVSHGRADLFEHKRIIITPHEPLEGHLLQLVTAFWEALGARVEGMPAPLHDLIYGHVSHLPQLLAFAAGSLLASEMKESSNPVLSRFLRLHHSSPALWSDIFFQNKENLLKALDRYLDVISHIRQELLQAPVEEKQADADKNLVRTALFPRIAASCMITTVMEAEKHAGFSFARYAGSGFADFTYPACQPPEADIESISSSHEEVLSIVGDYIELLKQFRSAALHGEEAMKTLLEMARSAA